MKAARLPSDENARLKDLHRYEVLDTAAERRFDNLTELASKICDCPIALVSLVDETRQWFKSKVGLDACETARDVAFCAHAIHSEELFQIPDSRRDDRFKHNPLVTGEARIVFYAGAPIISRAGHKLGTLCVIDHVPRCLSKDQASMLMLLSEQVAELLELHRQEHDLNRQKEQLKGIVDSMPLGLHRWEFDSASRLKLSEANFAADAILDLSHESKHGQDFQEIFPELRNSDFYEKCKEVARSGSVLSSEVVRDTHAGEDSFLSSVHFKSGPDSVTTLFQNISEIRNKEKQLEETHRKLQLMTIGSNDGFWYLPNLSEDRPQWSDRLFELLEYTPGELTPSLDTIKPMVHAADLDAALRAIYQAVENSVAFDIEVRIVHKSGNYHWYRLRGAVCSSVESGRVEMAGSISPIDATKELENQLRVVNQELERFAYRTSHDLKAPLLSSKRLTDFILEDLDDGNISEAKENVKKIASQMERLKQLVTDILSLVKADLRTELKQTFIPRDILSEIELDVIALLEGSSCKIIKSGTLDTPITFERVRIVQILENLISNSVKYRDTKKAQSFVKVHVDFLGDRLVFTVTDNGVGIPEEHQSDVYEAFTRFHTDVKVGSGLGLSIVKQHVDKLGGSVRLKSSSAGSEFTVSLPV